MLNTYDLTEACPKYAWSIQKYVLSSPKLLGPLELMNSITPVDVQKYQTLPHNIILLQPWTVSA